MNLALFTSAMPEILLMVDGLVVVSVWGELLLLPPVACCEHECLLPDSLLPSLLHALAMCCLFKPVQGFQVVEHIGVEHFLAGYVVLGTIQVILC